jgi:hypothetical protein
MTLTNSPQHAKEQSAAYLASLRATLGDRDPIATLAELPASIERETAGLTDEVLRQPEMAGKWAILQVVEHLADNEMIMGYRMRMILASDVPDIQPYDQEQWADKLHWFERSLADSVTDLSGLRGRNLRLIRSLSAGEMKRVGRHRERGDESVERLVWITAAHDIAHVAQIRRIRDRLLAGR